LRQDHHPASRVGKSLEHPPRRPSCLPANPMKHDTSRLW
jgi:hypothetical protein